MTDVRHQQSGDAAGGRVARAVVVTITIAAAVNVSSAAAKGATSHNGQRE